MRQETRFKFNAYLSQLSQHYRVMALHWCAARMKNNGKLLRIIAV